MQAANLMAFDEAMLECKTKMRIANVSELHISLFEAMYTKALIEGQALIREEDITPVLYEEVCSHSELFCYEAVGKSLLSSLAVIKLNGGLGTTMGLQKAKSLLHVKDGFSFLDIIVRQIAFARDNFLCILPLLFMNSFNTNDDTRAMLEEFSNGSTGIPTSFLQGTFPKIDTETWKPVSYSSRPGAEWNPPGHGDIYFTLASSGLLDLLLSKGIKYAFISNADNLGATVAPELLGYMEKENIPFLMEVTERTKLDSKGGHLAKNKHGRFILREIAHCSRSDLKHFQDIKKYGVFNTNSLWVNLEILKEKISMGICLEPICNKKKCDPNDLTSPDVIQLESAMGNLISNFSDAQIVNVSRSRFLPVKKNDDLIRIRSNQFALDKKWHLIEQTCQR